MFSPISSAIFPFPGIFRRSQWSVKSFLLKFACIIFSLSAVFTTLCSFLRRGADKSLARPGRKQATATKLGIYSTYSPRGSVHFLARCSNFCNPLKQNSETTFTQCTQLVSRLHTTAASTSRLTPDAALFIQFVS